MNNRQTMVAFGGLALILFTFWFGPQKGAVAQLWGDNTAAGQHLGSTPGTPQVNTFGGIPYDAPKPGTYSTPYPNLVAPLVPHTGTATPKPNPAPVIAPSPAPNLGVGAFLQ